METPMADVVKIPCNVDAAEGEVILECGSQAVSLNPEVAHQAGLDLQKQATAAKASELTMPGHR
jgi:hypothetical protein